MTEKQREAWVEIDTGALEQNMRNIRTHIGEEPGIMAVIKADAYGHGAVETARVLGEAGADEFAVATVAEGQALRQAGVRQPVTVLGAFPKEVAKACVEQEILPLIGGVKQARQLSEVAEARGKELSLWLALDTGMGRYGLVARDSDLEEQVAEIADLPGIRLRGLFTHFATADEADKSFATEQQQRLEESRRRLSRAGLEELPLCSANSGAIIDSPETWGEMVRPGIILYGIYPSDQVKKEELSLAPVMSVKARIIRIRTLEAGETAGYGRAFQVKQKSRIATLPLGYADGLPRLLSGRGRGLVRGRAAPIAGRICMDQCLVDVTEIPEAGEGDVVTLLGRDGEAEIPAEEIARESGTIPYEVVCRFGQRLEKVYCNGKGEKE